MDETLSFFTQLLSMTRTMVDDIVPDLLLNLDQPTLDRLMEASQETHHSLQLFVKLCGLISRKNLSRSNISLAQSSTKSLFEKMMNVVDGAPSQVDSSGDDEKSDHTNVTTEHDQSTWRGLLNEALKWYLSHDKQPIPEVYYCGICNKQAKAKYNWQEHLKGKLHLKKIEDVLVVQFKCEICGFTVCSEYEHIHTINASEEHAAFDKVCRDIRQTSSADSKQTERSAKDPPPKNEKPETLGNSVLNETPGTRPMSSRSNPVASSKSATPQNPPGKVTFQSIEIHADFVQLTDEVAGFIENHEAFEIGYCRPCDRICRSKEIWIDHKKTQKHSVKMSSKMFNNVLCRCFQCEFVVTAGEKIAVTYMKYHIERCHCQSTTGIKEEEYMEIKRFLRKKEPASNAGTLKGSHETLCSIPCSSGPRSDSADLHSQVDDLCGSSLDLRSSSVDLRFSSSDVCSENKPDAARGFPLTDSSSELQRDSGCGSERVKSTAARSTPSVKPTRKSSVNPYKSAQNASYKSAENTPSEVSDLDSLPSPVDETAENDLSVGFLQMLHMKEESFMNDRSFKLFTGLCTLCKTTDIRDRFQWMDHVTSHGESDSVHEVECAQCNSCFFGDISDINSSFISHDYHVCIDSLLTN